MPEDLLNMEKCGTDTVLEYPWNYPAFGQFYLFLSLINDSLSSMSLIGLLIIRFLQFISTSYLRKTIFQ